MSTARRKDYHFDLKATVDQKVILEQAAQLKKTSATSFILNAACEVAQNLLWDQSNILLSTTDWKTFSGALDNPPEPGSALRKLMTKKSRFKKG